MLAIPTHRHSHWRRIAIIALVFVLVTCATTALLHGAKPRSADDDLAVEARKPPALVLLQFKIEGPNGARRVSWDHLRIPVTPNSRALKPQHIKHVPQTARLLNGKRVRLRGFMSPSFKSDGLKAFLFKNDNNVMGFPGNKPATEMFPVRMRAGVTTDYILNRRFDVVGIFKVKPWIEDGEIMQIYEIVDAIVIREKQADGVRTLSRPR